MSDEDLHAPLIGVTGSRARLNTPALVLDLDALDANIARMAQFAREAGVHLRPHTKTHKSPDIARRQREAGAIGLCCAKIGEAEVMADDGLTRGLHISSPVVTEGAITRLIALNERTQGLSCVVDHPANVAALGVAAQGKVLDVMIDVDPGIHRTGVATPQAAVALWQAIAAQPMLRLSGVQCYCGSAQHIADFAAREQAMERHADQLRSILAALAEAGAPQGIVTGGGTGTHRIDVTLGLFTELQVGSYVFMDREYLDCDLGASPFAVALSVQASVVSANTPGMVTLDAGFKAFATDGGRPFVLSGAPEAATYHFMGDEHGALAGVDLPLASMVSLGVSHCDPTVNLYDTYHVVRGDTLHALWPVAARGRSR
jgi:D-serine deaminase-like pyridoxal phosphate-dependent protein